MGTNPNWIADQGYKRIARLLCGRCWAWLIGTAGSVRLPSCNPRQADTRPFGTPNRPVSVPHMRRCAGEALAGWNDERSCEEEAHWPIVP